MKKSKIPFTFFIFITFFYKFPRLYPNREIKNIVGNGNGNGNLDFSVVFFFAPISFKFPSCKVLSLSQFFGSLILFVVAKKWN